VSGRRLCFAFRIAGLATSSGFARDSGWPGGAFGLRMLSKTGLTIFFFCGEPFLAINQPPLTLFGNAKDAIAAAGRVSIHVRETKFRIAPLVPQTHHGFLEVKAGSEPLKLVYFCGGLGFTATRCFREDSQRIRGLCAAALLKLVNPIGHGPYHIARRFTCSIGFSLSRGPELFTLFDYSNCFLLRHCCSSELPVEFYVSNEFIVAQFPN
jgi:hypothetical protein